MNEQSMHSNLSIDRIDGYPGKVDDEENEEWKYGQIERKPVPWRIPRRFNDKVPYRDKGDQYYRDEHVDGPIDACHSDLPTLLLTIYRLHHI